MMSGINYFASDQTNEEEIENTLKERAVKFIGRRVVDIALSGQVQILTEGQYKFAE